MFLMKNRPANPKGESAFKMYCDVNKNTVKHIDDKTYCTSLAKKINNHKVIVASCSDTNHSDAYLTLS